MELLLISRDNESNGHNHVDAGLNCYLSPHTKDTIQAITIFKHRRPCLFSIVRYMA